MADGLLEVLSPPTLGTSANNGDDSSFELCAIAFFFLKDMDKEVRENGVGIRSLIAAWSRAGRHTTSDAALGQTSCSSPHLPETRGQLFTLARYIIIDGDTEWDTHWHPHV